MAALKAEGDWEGMLNGKRDPIQKLLIDDYFFMTLLKSGVVETRVASRGADRLGPGPRKFASRLPMELTWLE